MPFKVLIVDDERDWELLIRQRFRKKLQDGEFEFIFARHGEEALDRLKDDPGIDVVMSDLNMPVMDGLTLLSRVVELDRTMKTVVVSAYGDMQNIRAAMNLGAYDFLTKPIDLHDFEVTLDKTVRALETLKQGLKAQEHLRGTLEVVSDLSSELQLGPLLGKIIATISKMLNAERSTLFLYDERTNQLYTEVGEGLNRNQVRIPATTGIAGTVFTTSRPIRLMDTYADSRFNAQIDRSTGFTTRSILCLPVINKHGKTIGVTEVLNKIGGAFSADDEARLQSFTSQISIALENAKLFGDVQTMKNYNESILESMSSGVVAARLESACKEYGTGILVSASTFKRLSGSYLSREVDRVLLHGRSEPVRVFEVLDYHTEQSFPNLQAVLSCFAEGLQLYRGRRWDEATQAFSLVRSLNPYDLTTAMYLRRCEYLRQFPPPADWDGTWVMKSK